jgi:hypothetical protein
MHPCSHANLNRSSCQREARPRPTLETPSPNLGTHCLRSGTPNPNSETANPTCGKIKPCKPSSTMVSGVHHLSYRSFSALLHLTYKRERENDQKKLNKQRDREKNKKGYRFSCKPKHHKLPPPRPQRLRKVKRGAGLTVTLLVVSPI